MAIFAVLGGLAWFGLFLEKTIIGRVTTGLLWTTTIAMLLSNMDVIPKTAGAYDFIGKYLVPLAISMFLFQVNLRDIVQRTGRLFSGFLVGSAATVVGVVIATILLDLGPKEADLGGIFAATYIGGSVNFVATANALGMEESSFLSAAIAADSVVGNIYILLLALAAGSRMLQNLFTRSPQQSTQELAPEEETVPTTTAFSLASALTLSLVICALGNFLSEALNTPAYSILYISVLSLLPGTLIPSVKTSLSGSYDLGIIFAYVFFAMIGAQADVSVLVSVAPTLMTFAFIIVGTHAIIMTVAGRIMRLTLPEIITISNACILGPTTAAALAASRGWRHLITPGLLVGIFGYAVGTFIGVALVQLL